MPSLKESVFDALRELQKFIERSPWKGKYYFELERMIHELDHPCVLAVAGRVKAGKSSFINAFLGQDLALVGVTETTATINYFRYGRAPDPAKPVKCVWDSGAETWEDQAFLDSLQGNTIEVLKKATGIKHLEFSLDNPKLEHVRLVDTPGTGALVGEDGEGHQAVTGEFFQLQNSLRERHAAETESISGNADAVIYLTGSVVQQRDADFLFQFKQNSGGSALNMLGVLAKADMVESLLSTPENRKEYVDREAKQLGQRLSIAIPFTAVSAGIERTLQALGRDGLAHLKDRFQTQTTPEGLNLLLDNSEIYGMDDVPGCTLSVQERKQLCQSIPWQVFVVIVRTLVETDDFDAAVQKLIEYGGFMQTNEILERQFFQRGELLRCHTVIQGILRLLRYTLLNNALFQYTAEMNQHRSEAANYIRFFQKHHTKNETEIVEQFRIFLHKFLPYDNTKELKAELDKHLQTFENLNARLENVKRDFEGLRLLEEYPDVVTPEEKKELCTLFGQFGDAARPDQINVCAGQQRYWTLAEMNAHYEQRRKLAEIAKIQYSLILSALLKQNGSLQ